jgi:prolyl oligopeptidase
MEQRPNAASDTSRVATDDSWLWLEDVTGERALDWVERHNERALALLRPLEPYEALYRRNREILDSRERIAYPTQRGDSVYNFWRDAQQPRGVWRRSPAEAFLAGEPAWELLLDVDALAAAEGENWVWKGASCLRPDYRRCLLELSRGGADAVVVREFDLERREFVVDGFVLPEAKTRVAWIDFDTVAVGTDFGPGSMTDSGYPRLAKLWRRGQTLDEAELLFSGDRGDVSVGAFRVWDGARAYDFVVQTPAFFQSRLFLRRDGELIRVRIPDDAGFHGIVRGQLLLELKSPWTVDDRTYPQGALLSIGFERFLAGARDFQVVLEAGEHGALDGLVRTRNALIVNRLHKVSDTLERYRLDDGHWVGEPLDVGAAGTVSLVSADDSTDTFYCSYEDFLTPGRLLAVRDGIDIRAVQALPAYFDVSGMAVEQRHALSRDGTRVPYFLVTPPGFTADGSTPTLLTGYGGFEVSRKPFYGATVGHSWLERGGAYVLANIRGGGEFGPRWHQAALKANRQRAYDDFIAVAEDLIAQRVTSPAHLGIRGGSNGGLLMGVMLTQRPDLFNAIVCQVPLLDMRRYHRLLAGASWMAEYGDPDSDDWDYISRYSPYHNLRPGMPYPRVFFTTSTRDDRVHPGHARKMVARMGELGYDLLYYENTVGGHAGASDNEQLARLEALIFSYLWQQLGAARSG